MVYVADFSLSTFSPTSSSPSSQLLEKAPLLVDAQKHNSIDDFTVIECSDGNHYLFALDDVLAPLFGILFNLAVHGNASFRNIFSLGMGINRTFHQCFSDGDYVWLRNSFHHRGGSGSCLTMYKFDPKLIAIVEEDPLSNPYGHDGKASSFQEVGSVYEFKSHDESQHDSIIGDEVTSLRSCVLHKGLIFVSAGKRGILSWLVSDWINWNLPAKTYHPPIKMHKDEILQKTEFVVDLISDEKTIYALVCESHDPDTYGSTPKSFKVVVLDYDPNRDALFRVASYVVSGSQFARP